MNKLRDWIGIKNPLTLNETEEERRHRQQMTLIGWSIAIFITAIVSFLTRITGVFQ